MQRIVLFTTPLFSIHHGHRRRPTPKSEQGFPRSLLPLHERFLLPRILQGCLFLSASTPTSFTLSPFSLLRCPYFLFQIIWIPFEGRPAVSYLCGSSDRRTRHCTDSAYRASIASAGFRNGALECHLACLCVPTAKGLGHHERLCLSPSHLHPFPQTRFNLNLPSQESK